MAGKYTRIFPVTLDEVTIKIAPLTAFQTEQFLRKQRSILDIGNAAEQSQQFAELSFSFVADGLTNAGEEVWTGDRVKAELDKVFITALQNKIMEESGLVLPNQTAPIPATA